MTITTKYTYIAPNKPALINYFLVATTERFIYLSWHFIHMRFPIRHQTRWQPKRQTSQPKEPARQQTLDEFLTGVLIDVCRSRPSDASISYDYHQIWSGSSSRRYRLDVEYKNGSTRSFSDDSISVDYGEQPHDLADYIMGVLAEHNILSERNGKCLLMNTKPLRQRDGAEKIATILNTGADKPVSTAAVVNAYRRIHGREPDGFCMDTRELFEIGECLELSDQEILRRFRKYNSAS